MIVESSGTEGPDTGKSNTADKTEPGILWDLRLLPCAPLQRGHAGTEE
ncbi:MAG: hypothetical protein HFI65_09490 [Lachnospiraceae bacterium]|nr:hypothetical protein [Lachnospiraceae bacterium]